MGCRDDEVFVDFEDDTGRCSATTAGGSGDDTVTLTGAYSDYTVSQEDGYTDQNDNAITAADEVESV